MIRSAGRWRPALAALLAGCARVAAPPGGPTDQAPPRLISTYPDSTVALPGFKGNVEFRFDEVVSEGGSPNFGLGTGDLERLVLVSPSVNVPEVSWKRSRITVRPREGWRSGLVYRVELLPGVVDLSSNRSKNGRVVTFSTGAPLPTSRLRGLVVDWTTQRPAPRALVVAMLPDSLSYRTIADSTGHFDLQPLPAGDYLVHGVLDQNNNLRREAREPFDTVRAGPGRDSVGEIWVFKHDSTPPRVTQVAVNDSISVVVTFSQSLNPYQRLPGDSVEVLRLPDSTRTPVVAVLPKEDYDRAYPPAPRLADTAALRDTARARQIVDSLRADSIARVRADSLRADSLARARAAGGLQIPGVTRRTVPPPDTAGRGPLKTKPALFDKLFVRVGRPLAPGSSYTVLVHGIQSVSRTVGDSRGQVRIPEAKPPPADSAKAKPPPADSAKAKPDTGTVRRRR